MPQLATLQPGGRRIAVRLKFQVRPQIRPAHFEPAGLFVHLYPTQLSCESTPHTCESCTVSVRAPEFSVWKVVELPKLRCFWQRDSTHVGGCTSHCRGAGGRRRSRWPLQWPRTRVWRLRAQKSHLHRRCPSPITAGQPITIINYHPNDLPNAHIASAFSVYATAHSIIILSKGCAVRTSACAWWLVVFLCSCFV